MNGLEENIVEQPVAETLTREKVRALLQEKYLGKTALHPNRGESFARLLSVNGDTIEVELLTYGNVRISLSRVFDYVNVFQSDDKVGRNGVRLMLSLIDVGTSNERMISYFCHSDELEFHDMVKGMTAEIKFPESL